MRMAKDLTNSVKDPDLSLWRAVVNQAFLDATEKVPDDAERPAFLKRGAGMDKRRARTNAMEKWRTKQDRDKARAWLLSDSGDFREVCSLALYDPDAVADVARSLAAKQWETKRGINVTVNFSK